MVVCYFPKRPLVKNTRRLGTGCTRGKHCVEQRKLEEITAITRADKWRTMRVPLNIPSVRRVPTLRSTATATSYYCHGSDTSNDATYCVNRAIITCRSIATWPASSTFLCWQAGRLAGSHLTFAPLRVGLHTVRYLLLLTART